MGLVQNFKAFREDSLLQLLRNIKRVPFHWSTVSSVLLSVRAGDVHFLLSARQGTNLKRGQTNVLGAAEQHLEVLLSEIGVVVDDLRQVNQTDLSGRLRASLLENSLND